MTCHVKNATTSNEQRLTKSRTPRTPYKKVRGSVSVKSSYSNRAVVFDMSTRSLVAPDSPVEGNVVGTRLGESNRGFSPVQASSFSKTAWVDEAGRSGFASDAALDKHDGGNPERCEDLISLLFRSLAPR